MVENSFYYTSCWFRITQAFFEPTIYTLKPLKIEMSIVLVFLYVNTFKFIFVNIFYSVLKSVYFCQFLLFHH